ncbi:glutamate-gated chloride channel-like [Argiope bruennichi]|uniref:glutamate-gated chloride channel-like n=1 Tax=Argiope bruennichi TaxID=94029 RepID=UPI002495032B|nr:glutamate-gated chloride channel-like [Argiope bruennichi]
MTRQFYACIIAALLCLAASDSNPLPMTENAVIQEYFSQLKILGYNREVMPEGNHGYGSPVVVLCTMYLLDISEVNDLSMDYRAMLYFRQSWNDSRLAYPDLDIHSIVLNDPRYIWTPDLFFVQEKEGIHHNLIVPNAFIKISPEGEVLYSVRLSITFSCPMDFRKYPHDIQKCTFSVESYGRSRDKLALMWDFRKPHPVSFNKNISTFSFQLKAVNESIKHETFNFGEYTCLEVSIELERKIGFYMIQLYIPFLLLVVLSWLSFWIPSKMIALRLPLLLVVLYLMVNIGSGISERIPPVSYTKGSDVWIAVCESLVFSSFLESILVHIISRNKEKLEKKMRKKDPEAQRVLEPEEKMNPVNNDSSNGAVNIVASRLKREARLSKLIDKISALLFPCLFIVFNFVYWLFYCTGH